MLLACETRGEHSCPFVESAPWVATWWGMASLRSRAVTNVAAILVAVTLLSVALLFHGQGPAVLLRMTPRSIGESRVLTPAMLNALHPDAHHWAPTTTIPAASLKPFHTTSLDAAQVAALHGQNNWHQQERAKKLMSKLVAAPKLNLAVSHPFSHRELAALTGKKFNPKPAAPLFKPPAVPRSAKSFSERELRSLLGPGVVLKHDEGAKRKTFSLHQAKKAPLHEKKPESEGSIERGAATDKAAMGITTSATNSPSVPAAKDTTGAEHATKDKASTTKSSASKTKSLAAAKAKVFKTKFPKITATSAPVEHPEHSSQLRRTKANEEPIFVTPFGKEAAVAAASAQPKPALHAAAHAPVKLETPFAKAQGEVKQEEHLAAATQRTKDTMLEKLKARARELGVDWSGPETHGSKATSALDDLPLPNLEPSETTPELPFPPGASVDKARKQSLKIEGTRLPLLVHGTGAAVAAARKQTKLYAAPSSPQYLEPSRHPETDNAAWTWASQMRASAAHSGADVAPSASEKPAAKPTAAAKAPARPQALAQAGPVRAQQLLAHGFGTTYAWQATANPNPRNVYFGGDYTFYGGEKPVTHVAGKVSGKEAYAVNMDPANDIDNPTSFDSVPLAEPSSFASRVARSQPGGGASGALLEDNLYRERVLVAWRKYEHGLTKCMKAEATIDPTLEDTSCEDVAKGLTLLRACMENHDFGLEELEDPASLDGGERAWSVLPQLVQLTLRLKDPDYKQVYHVLHSNAVFSALWNMEHLHSRCAAVGNTMVAPTSAAGKVDGESSFLRSMMPSWAPAAAEEAAEGEGEGESESEEEDTAVEQEAPEEAAAGSPLAGLRDRLPRWRVPEADGPNPAAPTGTLGDYTMGQPRARLTPDDETPSRFPVSVNGRAVLPEDPRPWQRRSGSIEPFTGYAWTGPGRYDFAPESAPDVRARSGYDYPTTVAPLGFRRGAGAQWVGV